MTGTEPIRFGLFGYCKMEVRDFAKFAEGLTKDDLYEALGGDKNIKNKSLFDKMFKSIAKDDVMDAGEIKEYFEDLDFYAQYNELAKKLGPTLSENKDVKEFGKEQANVLWVDELNVMEARKGNVKEDASQEDKETMMQFVNALIKANDTAVKAEEEKAAEQADLEARTSYDKDGNKTVKEKGNLNNSVTYNKDGKMIQKVETKDSSRWTYNYDPETGRLESESWYYFDSPKDKNTIKYHYDENGKLVKSVQNSSGYKVEKLYNNGNEYDVAKEIATYPNGTKEIKVGDTTTTIYANGTKEVEKDGTTKFYDADGKFTGSVTVKDTEKGFIRIERDENNKVERSEEEIQGNPEIRIERDGNGKVTNKEVTTYYDNGYTRKNEKLYDGDNNLIRERKYDKKGNFTYEMEKNIYAVYYDGKLLDKKVTTVQKDGSWNGTGFDADGNVLYTRISKYRGNGNFERVTTYPNGQVVIHVSDDSKIDSDIMRDFHEDKDGNIISEYIRDNKADTRTQRYYKDGKVYAEYVEEKGNRKFYYKGKETTGAGFDEAQRGLRLYYSGLGVIMD